MPDTVTLEAYLSRVAALSPHHHAAASIVAALADVGHTIAELIAMGPLLGGMGTVLSEEFHGDSQKALDLKTNELVLEALGKAPVAVVGSEEMDEGLILDATAPLGVAIDPLDGSSNIETNASIGTIFSIMPVAGFEHDLLSALLQPGTSQVAGGFLIYGPQTSLLVSFGDGTQLFTYDRNRSGYILAVDRMNVAPKSQEYAINGSNYRHWDDAIRHYIDDCLAGDTGPHGVNYNTRWTASMVADAYRILIRGGIYIYPSDVRRGYGEGRLRLIYEANPISLVIEQAGGMATDGQRRILEIEPQTLHQRIPFVFGSSEAVESLSHYYGQSSAKGARSPLFRNRSVLGG